MSIINRYFLWFTLTLPLLLAGQNLQGLVIDSQTGKPIPYVNIGIIRGERGTVSNDQGYFNLDISGINPRAELRFSFIGYENHNVSIGEISEECSSGCSIQLVPKVLEMQEVMVFPRDYVEKVKGNSDPPKTIRGGFSEDSLGYEVGIRVRLKPKPTLVKEFRLHGIETTYDTVFYRINIYDVVDGNPGKNILREPIYLTLYDIENGKDVIVDLMPYHIVVQDDFFITLEYVRDLGEGKLDFGMGLLTSRVYIRKTSQAEWYWAPFNIGLSVLVRYEK